MGIHGIFYIFIISLLVSSIGFKNYVWFISIGYGLSIVFNGLGILYLNRSELYPGAIFVCILFLIYGLRLSGYLAYRELKVASYNKNMQGEIKTNKQVKFIAKVFIWITCALLYTTQVSGIYFRLFNQVPDTTPLYIGSIVMLFGLVLETVSDLQKNRAKKINPDRFVDTGLYRIVRCPNYLGELVFWTGVFIISIYSIAGPIQWGLVLIGYLGIVYVMFSGARRLEIRQNKRYNSNPEYQSYIKSTPILLPLIPLYTVEKYKWLVA